MSVVSVNIDNTTARVGVIGSFCNCHKKIENIINLTKNNDIYEDDYLYTNYDISDVHIRNEVKMVKENLNADIYVGDINGKKIYTNEFLIEKINDKIINNDIDILKSMMLKDKNIM